MLYSVAGSEQAYRDRPFAMLSCTFVVPPMKYATESCEVMEDCIDGGMPVLLLSAGQAGCNIARSDRWFHYAGARRVPFWRCLRQRAQEGSIPDFRPMAVRE